jgi:hypothetical protein
MAIRPWGRLLFLVDSHSRPGLVHLTDLEPELGDDGKPLAFGKRELCSCEANRFIAGPCRHIIECLEYLCEQLGLSVEQCEIAKQEIEKGKPVLEALRCTLEKSREIRKKAWEKKKPAGRVYHLKKPK